MPNTLSTPSSPSLAWSRGLAWGCLALAMVLPVAWGFKRIERTMEKAR